MSSTISTGAARTFLLMAAFAACNRAPSPTESYVAYRQAFDKAKAIEELLPFMDKATRAKVEAGSAQERERGFEMAKAFSEVFEVKVVKETVTGEEAVVEATGISAGLGADTRATVQFAKEDGTWKIKNERWANDNSAPKPPDRTCPELADDLEGSALPARARAAAALRGRICPEAVPALAALLTVASPGTRGNAAAGLRMNLRGVAGEHSALLPSIVAAKVAAAAEKELMLEIDLQSALASYGAPAVPHLVGDLKSPSRDLRWGAAAGLGMMGPDAKEALPALEAAAKEEKDATVGSRLTDAIKEVRGS